MRKVKKERDYFDDSIALNAMELSLTKRIGPGESFNNTSELISCTVSTLFVMGDKPVMVRAKSAV